LYRLVQGEVTVLGWMLSVGQVMLQPLTSNFVGANAFNDLGRLTQRRNETEQVIDLLRTQECPPVDDDWVLRERLPNVGSGVEDRVHADVVFDWRVVQHRRWRQGRTNLILAQDPAVQFCCQACRERALACRWQTGHRDQHRHDLAEASSWNTCGSA